MTNRQAGFTLLELLVVIIIVAILAAVAIPIYTNAVETNKGKACQNNIRTIMTAWRMYNLDNNVDYVSNNNQRSVNWVSRTSAQLNTDLNIQINERNFGNSSGVAGTFYLYYQPMAVNSPTLGVLVYRSSGSKRLQTIRCYYNFSTGVYDWDPSNLSTWDLPLDP